MVVVCHSSSAAISARSPSRHRTVSTVPGRDFFMVTGAAHTSSAPAFSSVSMAKAMSSAVISSTLQLSSATWPPVSAVSPQKARRQLAASNSLVPMP